MAKFDQRIKYKIQWNKMSKSDIEAYSANWELLKSRLAASSFRKRFKLSPHELSYLAQKGFHAIEGQAEEFIKERIAPAQPWNDGKQTPMRGHPVFIAQHATGACCRSCLEKWHGIKKGVTLNDEDISRIVFILMSWIRENSTDIDDYPQTPDLFKE